jgi:hypothetical protein
MSWIEDTTSQELSDGWHNRQILLVFFDPDKPGTTGETMSVLLNSLSGMDHKLLIVLNKADQFQKSTILPGHTDLCAGTFPR